MAFVKNKSQSRVEPTFVFVAGRKRDAKNAGDKQDEIPFTIPAFLRTGPASARTDKTSYVDFKPAPKGERKAKTYREKTHPVRSAATESPKAQTTEKNAAPAQTKSATTSWFDNDFARIAETAKPKYMTDGSDEQIAPVEPVMPRATHAAVYEDEAPKDIFIFEEPDDKDEFEYPNDEDEDEDEDDPADWQQAPYFADQEWNTPSSEEVHVPDNAQREKYRSSPAFVSRLSLIAAVGLGLFVTSYFWPAKSPDKTTSTVAAREAPAPAAKPEVDARTIVPAGPGQWVPNLHVAEVKPKVPVPNDRPIAKTSLPDSKPTTTRTASSTPAQPRHVELAPGPRPLSRYYSSSSSGVNLLNNGPSERGRSEREEAMLSDLAVNVQRKLTVLGYTGVPQTGQLDAATRSAVRTFQLNSGLPPTGEVDSQTLKLMSSMSHIE